MASFADLGEFEVYLGRQFADADDASHAQAMLDQATTDMKAYMRQDISAATETIKLDPKDTPVLVLPQWPVTAVSAVSADGSTLNVSTDIRWYRSGLLMRDNGTWQASWGWKSQSVSVTYAHGYATIPADLASVCKARAKRLLEDRIGLSSVSADGYSASFRPGDDAFLDSERNVMDGYCDFVSA